MSNNIIVEESIVPIEQETIQPYDPTFFDGLTAFEIQDVELLSSMQLLSDEIDEAIAQLSSMPTNLYEAEKVVLFGPDYKFKTLSEYVVPSDFVITDVIQNVEKSYDRYEKTMIEIIQTPQKFDLPEEFYGMSMLFEMSGNKVWESEEKKKKYIEHLEMIMSIDIRDINEENCLDIITKIAHSTNNLLEV